MNEIVHLTKSHSRVLKTICNFINKHDVPKKVKYPMSETGLGGVPERDMGESYIPLETQESVNYIESVSIVKNPIVD